MRSCLEISHQTTYKINTGRYVENGEWILLDAKSERNLLSYDCCEGKFSDVTYHLELRRRTLFYMMNFILPCVLIAVLTLLVFLLPPESGERMSFGVTVLLSFTILLLMLMVSEFDDYMCCFTRVGFQGDIKTIV